MSKLAKKLSLKKSDERINIIQDITDKSPPIYSAPSSGRQCIVILTIFLSIILLLGGFLGYSIYVNLQKMNQKLQKMELKFHKFLFYLKYIYKTEKQKEQIDASQNSSIMDLFTKFTVNDQSKKDSGTKDKKASIQKISSKNIEVPFQITKNKNQKALIQDDDQQLFSHQEMVDIAKKIIQEEEDSSKEERSSKKSKAKKNQAKKHKEIQVQPPSDKLTNLLEVEPVNNFNCQIDDFNIFNPNFAYDPQTQKLRKTVFTSRFETLICDQPIPKQGIWQLSIKITQTLKSFIYLGIAGGTPTQVYNITSFHENKNFYGYSGFSGRIWEEAKRKKGYEMIQKNTIFKLRVDIKRQKIEYFFNELKIGQSEFGNLCQYECRFVVEMYNDGDEVQFLHPLEVSQLIRDSPNKVIIQSDF